MTWQQAHAAFEGEQPVRLAGDARTWTITRVRITNGHCTVSLWSTDGTQIHGVAATTVSAVSDA